MTTQTKARRFAEHAKVEFASCRSIEDLEKLYREVDGNWARAENIIRFEQECTCYCEECSVDFDSAEGSCPFLCDACEEKRWAFLA